MENMLMMKKLLKKIKHIVLGNLYNLFKINSSLYKKRIKICNKCNKKIIYSGIEICGECGCPLSSKTRVLEEKCLMNKW